MRVLIIDDEEDTRSIFSMSLGLLGGAEVIEAASGLAGIEEAARERPDVIILDLLMPEMDGTQTFLNLKQNPQTESIPVIFMTVKGMFSEFDALKNLGALAVIAKPFDPTTLTAQIKSILIANGYDPENTRSRVEPATEKAPVSPDVSSEVAKPISVEPEQKTEEPVLADVSGNMSYSSNNGHHGDSNGRVPERRNQAKRSPERAPERMPERKTNKPKSAAQRILARKWGRSRKSK